MDKHSKREIQQLLSRIDAINKCHNKMAELTGDRFNIFRIIKLKNNDEEKIHTPFIAALLNPNGSHKKGALFLKLFLKQIENELPFDFEELFDFKTIKVNSEYTIKEGQVDIHITDANENTIVIENKLAASDGYQQLLRYSNYCERRKGKRALIYLTYYGDDASELSTGEEELDYIKISYKDDIMKWLEACRKECSTQPVLREGITHYINLLNFLLNQGNEENMKEILELVFKSKDNFESAFSLLDNAYKIKAQLQFMFWEDFRKHLEEELKKGEELKKYPENKELRIITFEDSDPNLENIENYYYKSRNRPQIGLRIEIYSKNDVIIRWSANCEDDFYTGFTIDKVGQSGVAKQKEYDIYHNIVKNVDNGYGRTYYWLGCKQSNPQFYFRDMKSPQCKKLFDEAYRNKVTSEIAKEGVEHIRDVLVGLKKL